LGRRFGQHFLTRKSILDRIAEAACVPAEPLVVEIGPGKGALTEPLLERAARVIAIEVDPTLVQYLQRKFQDPVSEGRLTLVEADVLKTNLGSWGPATVTGNLPYYITSPILESLFSLGEGWRKAVFLVQAEVAARIAAGPGSRDYGYLSVLAQTYAAPEVLFPVPHGAFSPPPKVESAVILLTPRTVAEIVDREAFLRFASVCFRHKRKTLRNNLAAAYPKELVDTLEEGRLRAEQLGIKELAALHRRLTPGLGNQ
jgi:16S rRNA (adenine1518-N6/adenine1519-N6)-dimethyltransferase